MKSKSSNKKYTAAHHNAHRRFEWTLLVYPVLVVAALAVLYGVSRSIQRESLSGSQASAPPAERPASQSHAPETTVPLDPARPVEIGTATPTTAQAVNPSTDPTADPEQHSALPDGIDPEELQGTARTVALLSQALKAGDNALIKQYMDELVLLGDEAVDPLSEIIANGNDETSLWAARALARIGTPLASSAMLETLALTPDGSYREAIIKEASAITNHDSWPVLLDALQESGDRGVMRAAEASLTNMADTAVVEEIVARYDAATTDEEANRLAQTIRNIRSPQAAESLLALAGDASVAPQDSLVRAAIDAVSNIADSQCVNYLLDRLEASPPGEGGYLFNSITNISQPQAEAALRYAAAGSKDVSAGQGRTAAICALENFPNEQTYSLLQQIAATDENLSVVSAASRTLDKMTNADPMVAINAATKEYDIPVLPSDPLKK